MMFMEATPTAVGTYDKEVYKVCMLFVVQDRFRLRGIIGFWVHMEVDECVLTVCVCRAAAH